MQWDESTSKKASIYHPSLLIFTFKEELLNHNAIQGIDKGTDIESLKVLRFYVRDV